MNSATMEERVSRLEARQGIDTLISDLGRAFDAGPSAKALRPLFTDGATFKIDQYAELQGADAIAEGVAGNADKGFRWTLHYLVSPHVVLDANARSARVDFYLWEVATAASGRAYWIGGRYVAEVVAHGSVWRFESLELQAELISHYPSGWQPKPGVLANA